MVLTIILILLSFSKGTSLNLFRNGLIGEEIHKLLDEKDFQNLWKSYPNHYHFQQKFDKNKRMNISMFWKNDTKLYTRIENKLGDYISLYHLTSNAKIHIYNYEFEVIDKIIHDVHDIAASLNEFAVLKNNGHLYIFDVTDGTIIYELQNVTTIVGIREGILAETIDGSFKSWHVAPRTFEEKEEIFKKELKKFQKSLTKRAVNKSFVSTTLVPEPNPTQKPASVLFRMLSNLKIKKDEIFQCRFCGKTNSKKSKGNLTSSIVNKNYEDENKKARRKNRKSIFKKASNSKNSEQTNFE